MTDFSLIEENGRAHFLTKRFDRDGGKKVHIQTFSGREMFLRMVFNVVVRNQDDHTQMARECWVPEEKIKLLIYWLMIAFLETSFRIAFASDRIFAQGRV